MTPDDILRYAKHLAGQHRGDWPLSYDERVSSALYGAAKALRSHDASKAPLAPWVRFKMTSELRENLRRERRRLRPVYRPPEYIPEPGYDSPDLVAARDEVNYLLRKVGRLEGRAALLVLGYGLLQREAGALLGVSQAHVFRAIRRAREQFLCARTAGSATGFYPISCEE